MSTLAREVALGPLRRRFQGRRRGGSFGNVAIVLGVAATAVLGWGLVRQLTLDGRLSAIAVLLIPLVTGAATGAVLGWRLRRDHRWLSIHEHGVVYAGDRVGPIVARWEDVVDVRGLTTVYLRYGSPAATAHTVVVNTKRGDIRIASDFPDAEEIGDVLAVRLVPVLLADMLLAMEAGDPVQYRGWSVSREELTMGGHSLRWDAIAEVHVARGLLRVRGVDEDGGEDGDEEDGDLDAALELGTGGSAMATAFVRLIDRMRAGTRGPAGA